MLKLLDIVIPLINFAISFYVLYSGLKSKKLQLMTLIIIVSFILPFISGVLWYFLCRMLNWPDLSTGTSGIKALIWGIISIGPISSAVVILTTDKKFEKIIDIFKLCKMPRFYGGLIIAGLAGIGAYIFYNIDFRGIIKSNFSVTYERLEFWAILIWSTLITGFSLLLLIFRIIDLRKSPILSVLLIPILSGYFCYIGLQICFLVLEPSNPHFEFAKGLDAGFCLRFGFFYGLLLTFDKDCYQSLTDELKTRWIKFLHLRIFKSEINKGEE